MGKNKGIEVSDDIKNKLTEYVYKNYASYKDKNLIIRDKGTHYTIMNNPTGGYLFLSKSVV